MRTRKLTFEQLVNQNKQEIMNDKIAMKKLEESLDQKHSNGKKSLKSEH